MTTAELIEQGNRIRAERLADEKRARQMAANSAARRVHCPACNGRATYTFRRSGTLLFCCYGCGATFDEIGGTQ